MTNNMRILFITDFLIKPKQGGQMVAENHYNALCNEYGVNNIEVVAFGRELEKYSEKYCKLLMDDSLCGKIKNIFARRPFFCSKGSLNKIMDKLQEKEYDVVYFDNSCMGGIAKRIKMNHPNILIVIFSHGVYANSERQIISRKKGLGKFEYIFISLNLVDNERLSTKYADQFGVLNKRDGQELEKWHHKKPDFYLPITYDDTATITKLDRDATFNILFVGGYFWPNVEGVKWFSKNVVPYIPNCCRFLVVGRGMEKLRNEKELNNDKVIVIGSVDDLHEWYNKADIVVAPIFCGDGMKTKTAEALMYGKYFLCTQEALCGYENLDEYHCETANEFISHITELVSNPQPRYNENLRQIFLKRYSTAAAQKILAKSFIDARRKKISI